MHVSDETSPSSNLPKLKTANTTLIRIGIVFTILITIIFGVIIGIGGWDVNPSNDTDLIPSTQTTDPINTNCSGVATEEIQSCCAQWAINNDMMLPTCVGSWQINNTQCTWTCTTDTEGI